MLWAFGAAGAVSYEGFSPFRGLLLAVSAIAIVMAFVLSTRCKLSRWYRGLSYIAALVWIAAVLTIELHVCCALDVT